MNIPNDSGDNREEGELSDDDSLLDRMRDELLEDQRSNEQLKLKSCTDSLSVMMTVQNEPMKSKLLSKICKDSSGKMTLLDQRMPAIGEFKMQNDIRIERAVAPNDDGIEFVSSDEHDDGALTVENGAKDNPRLIETIFKWTEECKKVKGKEKKPSPKKDDSSKSKAEMRPSVLPCKAPNRALSPPRPSMPGRSPLRPLARGRNTRRERTPPRRPESRRSPPRERTPPGRGPARERTPPGRGPARERSPPGRGPARERTPPGRGPARERRRVNEDNYSRALAQYRSMKVGRRRSRSRERRRRSRSRERRKKSRSPEVLVIDSSTPTKSKSISAASTLRSKQRPWSPPLIEPVPSPDPEPEPAMETPEDDDNTMETSENAMQTSEKGEEEDLSLLELRLRALQSAANKMTVTTKGAANPVDAVDSSSENMGKRKQEKENRLRKAGSSSPPHKAMRSNSAYWNAASSPSPSPDTPGAPSAPRSPVSHMETQPAPPGTDPAGALDVPLPDVPPPEGPPRPLISGDLHEILKIEDQQEQLQAFISYVIKANPAQDKATQLLKLVDFAQSLCAGCAGFGGAQNDDYEPIAMDLDSNLSSPGPSLSVHDVNLLNLNPTTIPLPPPPPLPSGPPETPPHPPPLATPPPPGTETPPLLADRDFLRSQQPITTLGSVQSIVPKVSRPINKDFLFNEPYTPGGAEYADVLYHPTPSDDVIKTDYDVTVPYKDAGNWAADVVLSAKSQIEGKFFINEEAKTTEEADDEDHLRAMVLKSLARKRQEKEKEETARLTDGLLSLPKPKPTMTWSPEPPEPRYPPTLEAYDLRQTLLQNEQFGVPPPPANVCIPGQFYHGDPYAYVDPASMYSANSIAQDLRGANLNLVNVRTSHQVQAQQQADAMQKAVATVHVPGAPFEKRVVALEMPSAQAHFQNQASQEKVVLNTDDQGRETRKERRKRRRRRPADYRRMMRRKEEREARLSTEGATIQETTAEGLVEAQESVEEKSFKFGDGDSVGLRVPKSADDGIKSRVKEQPLEMAKIAKRVNKAELLQLRLERLKAESLKSLNAGKMKMKLVNTPLNVESPDRATAEEKLKTSESKVEAITISAAKKISRSAAETLRKVSAMKLIKSPKAVKKIPIVLKSAPAHPTKLKIDRTGTGEREKVDVTNQVTKIVKEAKRTTSPMTIRGEEVPQHQPVVIKLGYDSDSSEDEFRRSCSRRSGGSPGRARRNVSPARSSLEEFLKRTPEVKAGSSMDEFLRNMRRQVEESSTLAHRGSEPTTTKSKTLQPIRSEPSNLIGKAPGLDVELEKRNAIINRLAAKTKTLIEIKGKSKMINLRPALSQSESNLLPKENANSKTLMSQARIDETARRILESLKSARAKTVESTPKREVPAPSSEHEKMRKNIAFCEEQIKKYRLSIGRDELSYREEKRRVEEKKARFVETMSTVTKLKEQLAASERVLTALDDQVKTGEEKLRTMQTKISAKRKTTQTLVQRISTIERVLDTQVGKHGASKRKAEWPISPIPEKRQPEVVTSSPEVSKVRLIDENTGLKALQKDLSQKLAAYKQLSETKSRERLVSSESFNHLLDADKIPLKVENSDLELNKAGDIVKKRRSLRDLQVSTLPHLEKKAVEEGREKEESSQMSEEDAEVSEEKKGKKKNEKSSEIKLGVLSAAKKARLMQILLERTNLSDKSSEVGGVGVTARVPHLTGVADTWKEESPSLQFDHVTRVRSRDAFTSPYCQYYSPLRAFRGYRLHRFYRTKEELSVYSAGFSHRLDPAIPLCRFQINGTCNDQKCPWQHTADYSLSMEQVLEDVVAYAPDLAGCTRTTGPDAGRKMIGEYVSRFCADHQEILTADQMAVLITSRVNECRKVKHPHSTPLEARRLTLSAGARLQVLQSETQDFPPLEDDERPPRVSRPSPSDVRYFPATSDVSDVITDVATLEARALDEPENVKLWMEVARMKLGVEETSACLDNALNVLCHALERNRQSPELWLLYLGLYSRRGDREHVNNLGEQAVRFTNDYHVWFKYLELTKSYDDKKPVCERLLSTLLRNQELEPSKKSHFLLETLLYLVQITLLSQTVAQAEEELKKHLVPVAKARVTSILTVETMTPQDLACAWLCYAHLILYERLPDGVFSSQETVARLVKKPLFVIEWPSSKSAQSPPVIKALNVLKRGMKCLRDSVLEVRVCLERNIIAGLIACMKAGKKLSNADILGELNTLSEEQAEESVWMLRAETRLKLEGCEAADEVLREASDAFPFCASLHHFWASTHLPRDPSRALEIVEKYILGLYDVTPDAPAEHSDPNFLYKCLLNLEFSLTITKPVMKPAVNSETEKLNKQRVHCWLNFALLLRVQGEQVECCDVYETALSRLDSQEDVQAVWISYLEFARSSLRSSSQLADLVRRCLMTSPCQFPLLHTHPSECSFYTDYAFHNHVIDAYTCSLSRDNKMAAYQRLVEMMPDNVGLRERYVGELELAGWRLAGQESSRAIFYDKMASPLLARSALSHALKEGKSREVRKLLRRCVELMPYSASQWKNYVLYETSAGSSPSAVETIIQQAADWGVRLEPFVRTLLSHTSLTS